MGVIQCRQYIKTNLSYLCATDYCFFIQQLFFIIKSVFPVIIKSVSLQFAFRYVLPHKPNLFQPKETE